MRIRDQDGAEGMGYTYTVGTAANAILSLIRDDLSSLVIGADASKIEDLWQRMWWHLHYAGRGGPASFALSAIDIALWDLKAKRTAQPL